jgi:hypothetical protein
LGGTLALETLSPDEQFTSKKRRNKEEIEISLFLKLKKNVGIIEIKII